MRKWRRAGIFLLLVLVLIIGFTLPTLVSRTQDARTDQTRETVRATPIQLDMESSLTLLQKLWVLDETTAPVELEDAQKMDEEEALSFLMTGLTQLFSFDENGIFYPVSGFSEVTHTINLKMSDTDSLIYWEFWLADGDSNQISAIVDDDTGLILSLRYTRNTSTEEREVLRMPETPLFRAENIPEGTVSVFSQNGIFGILEEAESSAEAFAESLQERYCGPYLRGNGYRYQWEVDSSEPADSSYLYSVMIVDDVGGYYVLSFTVSNNEVTIN